MASRIHQKHITGAVNYNLIKMDICGLALAIGVKETLILKRLKIITEKYIASMMMVLFLTTTPLLIPKELCPRYIHMDTEILKERLCTLKPEKYGSLNMAQKEAMN